MKKQVLFVLPKSWLKRLLRFQQIITFDKNHRKYFSPDTHICGLLIRFLLSLHTETM